MTAATNRSNQSPRALGLSLFYVPSMRNGGSESREDRGNAILSSLPLRRSRRLRAAVRAAAAGRARRHDRRHHHDRHAAGASASSMRISTTPSARGACGSPRSTGRTRQARSLVASTRHRGTADPRRRLQHLVRILGSGLPDPRAPIPRRSPDRSPADVPRSAEARSPVLQARARLERNVSSRGRSVPLGSLPAHRHRALPTYRFCRFYEVLPGSTRLPGSETP